MIRVDVALAFTFVLGFFLYLCAFGVRYIGVEAACLREGYPVAHVAWDFTPYCTREENEYEITITLEEARGR